jgi:hypothetical protein
MTRGEDDQPANVSLFTCNRAHQHRLPDRSRLWTCYLHGSHHGDDEGRRPGRHLRHPQGILSQFSASLPNPFGGDITLTHIPLAECLVDDCRLLRRWASSDHLRAEERDARGRTDGTCPLSRLDTIQASSSCPAPLSTTLLINMDLRAHQGLGSRLNLRPAGHPFLGIDNSPRLSLRLLPSSQPHRSSPAAYTVSFSRPQQDLTLVS